ncbi:type VI secretion system tip protein VgrG [Pseudomonas sp. HR96]|uniref:type VI secretion system Vgr family protein n=1 Tax=Pseudomonas sp. HR96 TaxID=1027966 RepID=UPI002A74CEB3|nr:type VI secretion system tip protein VgrG [Pseudomonas sp. HR96]WPO98711.1 type VI secretion system tip protein VgrG [Pseudomonas sp. HR96]
MSQPRPLFIDHTRHKLRVEQLDAPLDVLTFEGRDFLSQPFIYTIEFTSPVLDLAVQSLLGRGASFSLYPPPIPYSRLMRYRTPAPVVPLRTVYGYITAFERLSATVEEARYRVVLQPRLARLERTRHYAVYQQQSVPEIVEHILRSRHQFRGQHFQFKLARQYPDREQVIQFGESDLAFIQRLLAEVGIWYYFGMDDRLRIDVLELRDDRHHYLPDMNLPVIPPAGLQGDQDCVWNLAVRHRLVERDVSVRAYDYRDITAWMDGKVEGHRAVTPTYGEAYLYAEPYREIGDEIRRDSFLQSESGFFYARLQHERYLNQQTRLSGDCSSATLLPGRILSIQGTPPEAFAQRAVIVSLTSRAARDSGLRVTFEAIPRTEQMCFRPPVPAKPQIAGTIPARVTSSREDDPYGHIDLEGRYKVNFLFDRDTWPLGGESAWLRLARPYAGDTHGLHLPLIQGTEVAIAFEHGDPDRPYIAHALHDNRNPDPVTLDNYRRNVLRTPANNKLRMEDDRGREHVKLSTEHAGKSQLNLGHVVDAKKKQRGAGFELRSDGHGAIRAGKGLLISADEQRLAQGDMLEMNDAIRRLQQAVEQMQQVSSAAETASAGPANLQAQVNLLQDNLKQLQASVLLLSAPQGVALTSGEHLQLAAQDNLILNAGGHADMSVVRRLFMGIGQGLSLFVHKLGIKIVANQGPVQIQAQHGTLELLARNRLQISSSEDEIHITAKKKIILNGGGSYLTLQASGIEAGTDGEMNLKAARWEYSAGASMRMAHAEYPQAVSQQTFRFRTPQAPNAAGQGLVGMPYTVFADGTAIATGVFDASGEVQVQHQVVTQQYRLQLASGVTYQIPIPDAYRNPERGRQANKGLHKHLGKADIDHRNLYGTALQDATELQGLDS